MLADSEDSSMTCRAVIYRLWGQHCTRHAKYHLQRTYCLYQRSSHQRAFTFIINSHACRQLRSTCHSKRSKRKRNRNTGDRLIVRPSTKKMLSTFRSCREQINTVSWQRASLLEQTDTHTNQVLAVLRGCLQSGPMSSRHHAEGQTFLTVELCLRAGTPALQSRERHGGTSAALPVFAWQLTRAAVYRGTNQS